LGNTPSQEDLNDIADVIEDKTGEELQDKSLSGILQGIIDLIPNGVLTTSPQELTEGQQEQVLENLALTDVLRYSEQSLTDTQKEQVFSNLGIPRPIVLTADPQDGDTIEDLAEKGLTLGEIESASKGLRTAVIMAGAYYPIAYCVFRDTNNWEFVYRACNIDDESLIESISQYSVACADGALTIVGLER